MTARTAPVPRRDFLKLGSAVVITAAIATACRRAAAATRSPETARPVNQGQAPGQRSSMA
jgi:hypothetical protein